MTRARQCLVVAVVLLCVALRAASGESSKPKPEAGRANHAQAIALLRAKDYAKALRAYDDILAADPQDKIALYNAACAYALMERKAEAIAHLEKSIDAGYTGILHLARDPDLKCLRKEAGYKAILARFAAPLKEGRSPGVANIRKILEEPKFRKFIPAYLPRYYSPELTPLTARLLEHKDAPLRRAAVISLLQQNAVAEKLRARIAGLLGDASADVREVAGEYLLWHGTKAELAALKAATAKERDAHALASMRAATRLIDAREKRPAAAAPRKAGKKPPPQPATYVDAWLLLRTNPTAAIRRQALEAYRSREKFEPQLRYTGKSVEGKRARERNARLLLAAEIFGFRGDSRMKDAFRPKGVPAAKSFMPPVRDFFNPKRKSFGLHTGKDGKVFGNSVHVGDDMAWQADQRTVVAIADGCVRRVSHVQSWGYIVIVEHKLPDGKFVCSLYAHLAPSICVKPGDIVKKGAKIGSVGRSHTWENGGYWSHLHFGIHEGPYLSSHPVGRKLSYTLSNGVEVEGKITKRGDPFATVKVLHKGKSVSFDVKQEADWICGYINIDYWKAGQHGWLTPQKFIRERLTPKKAGEPEQKPPPAKIKPLKPPKKTAA
jgi:murein DD-endopeptidase MepM/ murein hydrolase activator NlpD